MPHYTLAAILAGVTLGTFRGSIHVLPCQGLRGPRFLVESSFGILVLPICCSLWVLSHDFIGTSAGSAPSQSP